MTAQVREDTKPEGKRTARNRTEKIRRTIKINFN
jgi:hypothetical protein